MAAFETFGISLIDEQKFRQIVIDFISNHQGCIAEDIVKGQKQIGRKKLFRILPALKEENIVTEKKSKPGARNKKLFVNETNPLVIVPKELNEFDEAFTRLLKKAAKVIDQELDTIYRLLSKNSSNFTRSDFLYYIGQAIERIDKFPKDAKAYQLDPSKFEALDLDTSVLQVLFLIMEPINLFFSVADAYLIRSTIIWPNIIQDKETLRKLSEIVFVRIGYIQFNLSEFLRITKLGDMTKTPFIDILHRLRGTERLRNYKKYIFLDMKEEVEQIFDSLWAINSDIQRYAYPEASMYNWNFTYGQDNWRKLLDIQKEFPDEILENYGAMAKNMKKENRNT